MAVYVSSTYSQGSVKQLNEQLRKAAQKAKGEARAMQEDRRAGELENRHLQTAALASALELANRIMSQNNQEIDEV